MNSSQNVKRVIGDPRRPRDAGSAWGIGSLAECRIDGAEPRADPAASILIADRQSLCRQGLIALLQQGNEVATAQATTFGAMARQLSANASIGLAIVDLELPDLNGVAGILRVRNCFPDLRLVIMGAQLDRDAIVRCLAAGVHGCIPKTLPIDEISEALRTILGGRIYVPLALTERRNPDPPAPEDPKLLSGRQREILDILATGKSNKEIARELGIAEGTVKVHMNALFRTLGVHNRICAVEALRNIERFPQMREPEFPEMSAPTVAPIA